MPPKKISIAREVAYDAFVRVMEQRETPEQAMIARIEAHSGGPLKRIDRNFVKEVLFGALRWYSKIFWIVQNTAKRDLGKSSPQVRASLVLGAYQIFYMDRVPDRASVNESVEYIRQRSQAGAVPFVNGVLRAIARRAEYFPKPDKEREPLAYLSLQYAHPEWIVERWLGRFGFEKVKGMLAANNQPPPISIRLNSNRLEAGSSQAFRDRLLKEERIPSERQSLRSCLRLRDFPRTGSESLFGEGLYTFQDEASQLIAHLVDPRPGEVIIDACAGSGGKTGHLMELSGGEARCIALDTSAARIRLGEEAMERLGHGAVTWREQDFLSFQPEEAPNKILLDAPCSGLGVLRRHPEGKWHKTAGLITKMAALQQPLIEHAIDLLPEGGELIYSVCSFEVEEGPAHIAWLQERFGDKIELVSPVARLPDYYKRFVTRENVLLIFSGNKDQMDGFCAFVVRKVA